MSAAEQLAETVMENTAAATPKAKVDAADWNSQKAVAIAQIKAQIAARNAARAA